MVKAIFALSADPIHYGHIDTIERASRTFDELVVGIGANADKKYMFSLNERMDMAGRALAAIPNVRLVSYNGLLVNYAYKNGIPAIVKAVRNSADFEYEKTLHRAGESQGWGIETHILFARPELEHMSSSMVKAIQKEHGEIHKYVPLHVKQCLETKMSGQHIIGVTGEVGAGKSYVSSKLEELGMKQWIPVHNIELDYLGHEILGKSAVPKYQEIRETIACEFGDKLKLADGSIDRKSLAEIVFNDHNQMEKLNDIMHQAIKIRLREELRGKRGVILINAALIAEADIGYLCNNNVLMIGADKQSQQQRLKSRGLTDDQIGRRIGSQYNLAEKKDKIEEMIERDRHGKIWTLDNSDGTDEQAIERIFEDIKGDLRIK